MSKEWEEGIDYYCDVCGNILEKGSRQKHHRVPKLLRRTISDEEDKVPICPTCHLAFHNYCNFNKVRGKSKVSFKRAFDRFKKEYDRINVDFQKFLEKRKGKEDDNRSKQGCSIIGV